jgi:hypothetical protein
MQVPVYYLSYNPLRIPFQILTHDRSQSRFEMSEAEVCCRVLPASEMHRELAKRRATIAQFQDAQSAAQRVCGDDGQKGGWSLSEFVTDVLLRCRGGAKDPSEDSKCPWGYFYGISQNRSTGVVRFRGVINILIEAPAARAQRNI